MTTLRLWLCVGALVLASGAEASTLLRDLRHSVSRERTRLALEASGAVTYAAREEDGHLVLRFADLRLAQGVFAGRRYGEGLIERVAFERTSPDTVTMSLAFRPGATYRIVRPSGGALEIHAEGPYYAPPPARKPPAQPKQQEPAPQQLGRLIDIAALAMEQARAGQAAPEEPLEEPTAEQTTVIQVAQSGVSGLGWVLAVILSLATTAVTLLILARRLTKPAARVEPAVEATGAESVFSHNLLEALASGPENPEEEDDEEASAPALLAERFQRGADEVDLAFKLRGAGAAEAKARLARELGARAIPASRLAQSARRGGVGIGEMELARNLTKLATAQRRKEKTP